MMVALKVRRSTIAGRRGSVKVLVQRLVGRDGDAGCFFTFGQDLEQQLGAAAVESV
jgi:hypothetical protein